MVVRWILSGVVALASSAASAAILDTTTWIQDAPPSLAADTGSRWHTRGFGVAGTLNGRSGALVSDFDVMGDFAFSASLSFPKLVDNDPVGLVFGWQDNRNHYRFGMNGFSPRPHPFGYPDLGSSEENGVWLIREDAGVDTVLFNDTSFSYLFTQTYSLSVSRSGSAVSFKLSHGGASLFSKTFTDVTYTSGKIGVYAESMNTLYTGIRARPVARNRSTATIGALAPGNGMGSPTVVPLPASLAMLLTACGLLPMIARRRVGV